MKQLELNFDGISRSNRLHRSRHPVQRVLDYKQMLANRRIINMVKKHLLKASTMNGKWKEYALQNSPKLGEFGGRLIDEMILIRKKRLLNTIYELVFRFNIHYELAYTALSELLPKLRMTNQLNECMRGPLTMIIYVMYEHSNCQGAPSRLEKVIKPKD